MITLKTLDRTPSLAELKVSYRRGKSKDRSQIVMPFRVASAVSCERYLRQVWDADTIELREEFVVVCLNGSHEILGWIRLCTGGFNHAQVDIRLLLGVTLQTASTSIIVAHNHPSGNLKPSEEDYVITRRIAAACEAVGVRFLDHIILSRAGYFSFVDNGGW